MVPGPHTAWLESPQFEIVTGEPHCRVPAEAADAAAVSAPKTSPKAELTFLSVNFDLKAPVVFCGQEEKG